MALILLNGSFHGEQSRRFTVRDSIEMTMFSDPHTRDAHAQAKISINGRYAFIVTTKGNLRSNHLISTIWLYDMTVVRSYLRGDLQPPPPPPRLLYRASAVPRAQQFDSYGSIITKVQWSSGSDSILFLQEGEKGVRRLMRVNLTTGTARLLSNRSQNVIEYAERKGVIAYVAESPTVTVPPMDGSVTSVSMSGISLLNALDRKSFPIRNSVFKKNDLWTLWKGKRSRVNTELGDQAWHYPVSAANFLRLSISPRGDAMVAAVPVRTMNPEWKNYRSLLKTFNFKALPATNENGSEDFGWPWHYAYVDLRHNTVKPLFEAPSAWPAGYGDANLAVWSDDGSRVLVTNTYLPAHAGLADPLKPCAVAVYHISNALTQCIAPTRYPETASHLRGAAFNDVTDVSLTWESGGRFSVSKYHQSGEGWHLMETNGEVSKTALPIRLFVEQGLNQPPSLWAEDTATKTRRQLWNPNPQLDAKDVAKASVIRWRDRSGYEWKAGLLKPPQDVEGALYPLVVQTHGFDEHEFLMDGAYTTGFAAQALASAGFFVLQMESRRDRHGLPPETEATSFADGCADGIEALLKSVKIDPKRIGIIGFSRTAWYVETTLERYPTLFRAASIIDGIDQGYLTYSLFCPSLASCKLDHEASNGGPPYSSNLVNWSRTAASFNLDKIEVPVRIEAIEWHSLLAEWELYSGLLLQKKEVELNYIPGGQHILQQPKQRFASQNDTVTWFSQKLR